MDKFNWIKMGLRIFKVFVVFSLVLIISSNKSEMKHIKTENFNFNVNLGMTANAKKDEEKKPEPVVEQPPKVNTSEYVKYTGDLTGYAADCPACNGTLACKPKYNVYKNNVVTYNDKTYGKVRIVASSQNLACGSIIKFNLKSISKDPIYAIVLDRGVLGRDIDLLMPTEKDASKIVGRRKTTYEVIRTGW